MQHVSELYPHAVHNAVEALFIAMGRPVRTAIETVPGDGGIIDPTQMGRGDYHPVFGLMRHYQGDDAGDHGITENPYRGDHVSIPMVDETHGAPGSVWVLEISFHKGITFVERIDYPDAPDTVLAALYDLLSKSETR
jgi:hypothetical protein